MTTRKKIAFVALALGGLSAIALAAAWTRRHAIASELIDDYLAEKGVQASYDLVQLGTKHQRLENLVIGDPLHPDLTAKWAEVDGVASLSGFRVTAIRAQGVRLFAKWKNGKLDLGAIDKLRPPPSKTEESPFPDLELGLADARARIESEFGTVGARIDGQGNLAKDFVGQLGLVAPRLRQGNCAANGARIFGSIRTRSGAPSFVGPARFAQLQCAGANAQAVDTALDGTLDSAFSQVDLAFKLGTGRASASGVGLSDLRGDGRLGYSLARQQWQGFGDLRSPAANAQRLAAKGVRARFDFVGNPISTKGKATLDFAEARHPQATLAHATFGGDYEIAGGGVVITSNGKLAADRVTPSQNMVAQLAGVGKQTNGTPIAPIGASLARSLAGLGRGGALDSKYAFGLRGGRSTIALSDIRFAGASGINLAMSGRPSLLVTSPGGVSVRGTANISGGGLPTSQIAFAGGPGLAGTATIAAMQAGGSRLSTAPIRFAMAKNGLQLDTIATIDGPLNGGMVKDVTLPVALRGGAMALNGCHPIGFGAISLSGLNLEPGKVTACVNGSAIGFEGKNLSGSYEKYVTNVGALNGTYRNGAADFQAKAASLRLPNGMAINTQTLDGNYRNGAVDFTSAGLVAKLSKDSHLDAKRMTGTYKGGALNFRATEAIFKAQKGTQFDMATLDGRFANNKAEGRFASGKGQINNVPLLVSEAGGSWRFARDVLSAKADAFITDASGEKRFERLQTQGFELQLARGKVTGSGALVEPATQTSIGTVLINHSLSSGIGNADLSIPGLKFTPRFQPDRLTPLTIDIAQYVDGTVSGNGRIDWTQKGVTSTGRFRTDGLNLAAAFGPVTDLKGEIVFSDLLGLETNQTQTMTMGSINPGVLATDGVVRYRLLAERKIAIEGGEWPLAGGKLTLDPTVLDMAERAERRLNFHVTGLDAARFVAQQQFENISATGTFNGNLPIIFDRNGGRIERGSLIAQGGGTVSYIGEVSKENLGTYGMIAFDALKSMRFKKLTIDLGGSLDGEMVTLIKFEGVNQLPVSPGRASLKLPVKIMGLKNIPFIFNINIRAPFRRLLWMAHSFQDPSELIKEQLEKEQAREKEEQEKAKTKAIKPVKPPVREK